MTSPELSRIRAAAGRKGQLRRWAHATPEQKQASLDRMNAAKRAAYERRAADTFSALGVEPTREMVATAATMLQRNDLRERAIRAHAVKAVTR